MSTSRLCSFVVASLFAVGLAGCAAQYEEPAPAEHDSVESQSQPLIPGVMQTAKPYVPAPGSGGGYTPPCGDGWEYPAYCPTGLVACGCYCKTLAQCRADRLQ